MEPVTSASDFPTARDLSVCTLGHNNSVPIGLLGTHDDYFALRIQDCLHVYSFRWWWGS